jgi:hypothetical protein
MHGDRNNFKVVTHGTSYCIICCTVSNNTSSASSTACVNVGPPTQYLAWPPSRVMKRGLSATLASTLELLGRVGTPRIGMVSGDRMHVLRTRHCWAKRLLSPKKRTATTATWWTRRLSGSSCLALLDDGEFRMTTKTGPAPPSLMTLILAFPLTPVPLPFIFFLKAPSPSETSAGCRKDFDGRT